jgi:hypothetical protein
MAVRTQTTWHHLTTKFGTNYADKQKSHGRHSSLADPSATGLVVVVVVVVALELVIVIVVVEVILALGVMLVVTLSVVVILLKKEHPIKKIMTSSYIVYNVAPSIRKSWH